MVETLAHAKIIVHNKLSYRIEHEDNATMIFTYSTESHREENIERIWETHDTVKIRMEKL